MAYVIGIVLALSVSVYATTLRLDRDRAFYPTVLVVIASYYVLFAAMAGSGRVIVVESLIAAALTASGETPPWVMVGTR
jgi:Na+/melibiose symporter-like transporter